jgi:hypothetical protein
MNQAKLHEKLIAAARAKTPEDRVPLAFEQRVMSHLKSRMPVDLAALWGRALWRAAAPCVALTLLFSAWSWLGAGSSPAGDLSQDFENTLLAVADQDASAESIR